jgi:CHAT domain-containing protein
MKSTVIWLTGSLLSSLIAIAPLVASAAIPKSETKVLVAAASLSQGRSLYEAGQFAEAATAWQQAAQHYASQGDRQNQSLSLSYLSLAYQQLNQWDAAKTAIEQGLALLKTEPNVNVAVWAQILNTHGNFLLQTGQSQAALETWQQAEKFYHQADDRQGVLGSQLNQAEVLQVIGYYQRSRKILAEINQQLIQQENSAFKVKGLHSLGNALRNLGDLTASQEVLEQSLLTAQVIGVEQDVSAIRLSLGNLAQDNSDINTAQLYFASAEQTARNPVDYLQAQLNLLRLYIESKQTEPIQLLAKDIQQQLSQMPLSRPTIYATVNLASTLSTLDSRNQPLPPITLAQLLANAVQSARALKDGQAEAYALGEWGRLYARQGQTDEAIRLLRKSLTLAQSLQANNIISQSAWEIGRLLNQTGNRKEAISAYTQAVEALQALRSDLVGINQEVQFSFRESVEPVYRELVGLLLSDNPDQSELIQVRELIEALQLAELDNFFRDACLDSQPRQIDQIDPNAVVFYSIMLPDRLAIILSTAGQPLRYYSTSISKSEAEQTFRGFLTALHPASDRAEQFRLSQKIYDWLIRPAETANAFQGKQTLVFILDGLMRKIPMAALHDGKHYLLEKYAIVLSPGLKLMQARDLEQQKIQAVVGGISTAREGFSALPNVEKEVTEISHTIPASTLLNQEMTRVTLKTKLETKAANIVHLATHGQFSSNQEETYLLTWDGRLNIRELSELLRQRESNQAEALELLVLSACNTAAGDDRAVLGLAGLAIKSGARSTMASLWPVRDQVAARLMTQFYQHLNKPNTSKAEALRQSQLALLADESYNDPFFWSSFVLVGNWL